MFGGLLAFLSTERKVSELSRCVAINRKQIKGKEEAMNNYYGFILFLL